MAEELSDLTGVVVAELYLMQAVAEVGLRLVGEEAVVSPCWHLCCREEAKRETDDGRR